MAKDSVAVRIAGHEYKIRSDGDADSLREIASYVDRAMGRVRERTGTVDSLDVAVLTCLNLAREILSLHGQQTPSGAIAIDEDKLRSLIERVERSMASEGPAAAGKTDDSERAGGKAVTREAARPADLPSKTLELPSVEALRERTSSVSPDSPSKASAESPAPPSASHTALVGGDVEAPGIAEEPKARVAAGGRERAS